jgi:hypothetical protein
MARKRVIAKERRLVPIPDDLRESLREVHELIQEAEYDRDIDLDFDDAIQVGNVCGGRVRGRLRPYQLTYYPPGDSRRGRWQLALGEADIEDIADGRMTSIRLYCCVSSDCRSKFSRESDVCFVCDYEDTPEEAGYKAKLQELANSSTSKAEFVAGYVRIRPDATSASLIGDYNPIENLGERLGWFSTDEANELINSAKAEFQGQQRQE